MKADARPSPRDCAQRVSGTAQSRFSSAQKLRAAEAGRIAAERTVATLKARAKSDLADRTTPKGKVGVAKRIERAETTLDTARERVKTAKAEFRTTHAELRRRGKAAVREYEATGRRAEKALQTRARHPPAHRPSGQPDPARPDQRRDETTGVEPPGFVTHRQPRGSDFYSPTYPAPRLGVGREPRTGASVLAGTHVGGIEGLYRSLRQAHGLVDRVENWNDFVSHGVEVPGVTNMAEAWRMARDPQRHGLPPDVVPVRRWPFTADSEQITTALEHQDPIKAEDAAEGLLHSALATDKQGKLSGSAVAPNGPDSPIAFLHKDLVQRYAQHNEPMSPAMRRVQAVAQGFKRAVLPWSPSFYYGNAIDNTIRTALEGINPAHFVIGAHAMKYLTPEEKDLLRSGELLRLGRALLGSPKRRVSVPRQQGVEGGRCAPSRSGLTARAWRWRAAARGTALALPRAVSTLSHGLMAANSALTEMLPQYGAIGKLALAEFRKTQGSTWVKALMLQDELARQLARDVKDQPTLLRLRKQIEETYGNWSRMSPQARKFWSNVTPFWTWTRAALKFSYITMPAHHPIQTGFLAAAERATEPNRAKLGLSRLDKEPLPGWLQGGLPINGGISAWGKYTSFGYAGAPIENVERVVLPYLSGSLENLGGTDWKGLQLPGGELARVPVAFTSFLESFVPGVNLGKGLLEKGPEYLSPLRSYPRSTTDYLRKPKQQISVPVSGSGSGTDTSSLFGSGSSGTDTSNLFGGG